MDTLAENNSKIYGTVTMHAPMSSRPHLPGFRSHV
jgi:hypothetical protein